MTQFSCEASSIEPYQCQNCNFSTLFLRNLENHSASNGIIEETEIVSPNYICTKNCTLETYSKSLLRLHERKCLPRNWFESDRCNYRTERKETLQNHIGRKHHGTKLNNELKKRKNLSEKKRFQCDLCPYKGQWKSDLKKHHIYKHLDYDEINWFKCDHCMYKCKRRCNLQGHILSKHTNSDEINWFKCNQCAYKAKRKYHLKLHKKVHLNENLQCEKCDCKFENREKLEDHLLEHGDLFKCEFCSYKTQKKTDLKRHNNSKHVDEDKLKWFICYHCNFKSTERYKLKRHFLFKHSNDEEIEWFQCDHCIFKSKYAQNLKKHVNSKHAQ